MSMVIDLHAHVVLEESFGAAGEYGPELSFDEKVQDFRVGDYVMRVPYRGSVFMDAQKRVEAMDALGIDLQLLSMKPIGFGVIGPGAEEEQIDKRVEVHARQAVLAVSEMLFN